MTQNKNQIIGFLPDETPSKGKLILFALQQVIVMFPATVLVALLTGFHVSTVLFSCGLSTLFFNLITKGRIPMYYGSSFTYISAIVSLTGVKQLGQIAPDALISQAQFGILASSFISIIAGLIINHSKEHVIKKVLPSYINGTIAMIIGLSLAGTAMTGASTHWGVALITLAVTIICSIFLKGTFGQLSILFGIIVGYVVSIPLGLVDFAKITSSSLITLPHFTLPTFNWTALLAVMPLSLATIPESSAHLYQLDLYVNDLAEKKHSSKKYNIKKLLGLNLIGDGLCDLIASLIGGSASTNYAENLSTMSITRNFSTTVIMLAAIITMFISFSGTLSALIFSVPSPVINGLCIYIFGFLIVQGLGIMVNDKVDVFNNKVIAVIAVMFIIGIGGTFGFENGMIPIFGAKLPAIATSAIVGILLNLILNFRER
jgi:uracil permease